MANLDGERRFRFPDPNGFDVSGVVSQQRARELAIAWMETFVTNPSAPVPGLFPGGIPARETLEASHGGPVDWERVEAGHRVFNVESHLMPLPDSVAGPARRAFGPYYAIPFFVDGIQVAAVTVSALATNMVIERGRVHRSPPTDGGGEFSWAGVPNHWQLGVPVTPEEIVRFVATTTGAKIREVPVAARVSRLFHPLVSRWIVTLDREVEFLVRHDSSVITADTVHIAISLVSPPWQLRIFVPAPDQPVSEEIAMPGGILMSFPIKKAMPTRLVEVVPLRE